MKKIVIRILIALLILFILSFAYYQIWFLRQPERLIPSEPAAIVSPANGRVVAVLPWQSDSLLIRKEDDIIQVMVADVASAGTMISIEMDVTHVHYQRAPLAGSLINEMYTPGKFRNALVQTNKYGIRTENEHNSMLFETAEGMRYKVVQIAGLLARRIEDYVAPGQEVKKGEVIGLIKLGSQVSLILPQEVKIDVKVGDTVTDGESILGYVE